MTAAHAARIIATVLALFIGLPVPVGWTQEGGTTAPVALNGAGATFPAPLYKKWIAVYHAPHRNVSIAYDAVGSGEGIKRFLAETIDFAGSDEFLPESGAAKVEADTLVLRCASAPDGRSFSEIPITVLGRSGGWQLMGLSHER